MLGGWAEGNHKGYTRWIQFDENVVLLDYTSGRLVAIDVKTGRDRWEVRDGEMAGEKGANGVIPLDDLVLWYNGQGVRGIGARDP